MMVWLRIFAILTAAWLLGMYPLASGQFSSTPTPFGCDACPFPILVDFDLDDDVDLVFPRFDTVRWMQNLGGGDWAQPVVLTPNDTHFLTITLAADMDNDGLTDLVGISPSLIPDGLVVILRNTGTGFEPVIIDQDVPSARGPEHAIDLDNDGDLDLLGLPGRHGEFWYRNNGAGNFQRELIRNWCDEELHGPYTPIDVEGDGDLDLACFSPHHGRVIVQWNLGQGIFGPSSAGSAFIANAIDYPNGIVCDVADVNSDGLMDLVLGGRSLISLGYGVFQTTQFLPSRSPYQAVANVDCDLGLEAVLSGGSASSISTYDLVSDQVLDLLTNQPMRSALIDVNDDGRHDLLTGPENGTGSILWHLNTASPPEVVFELPAELDTLHTGEIVTLSGGIPTGGGGSYAGPGVFDGLFYALPSLEGYVVIRFAYGSYHEQTGCIGTAEDSIYVVNTVGIASLELDGWRAYPNPADEELFIISSASGCFDAHVLDAIGRICIDERSLILTPGAPYRLDTAHLRNGVYQLVLQSPGHHQRTIRFMVTR